MRKRRRRSGNARFVVAAVVLLILVAALALVLKQRDRANEQVSPENKPEVIRQPEPEPPAQKPADEPEPEPEVHEASMTEEEIQAQRDSFVTDYESAPLLNTTAIKYLTMEQGTEPGELQFNWFSPSGSAGKVVVYNIVTGETKEFPAQASASATEAGYYYNKATVSGLAENSQYAYHVGNGDAWSPEYQFKTKNFSGDFTFLVTSDAQIGQSEMESMEATIETWDKVVTRLTRYVPEAAFMVHLGDQVAGYNEPTHYSGFFDHLGLFSIPLVPVVGNHDVDCWESGGGPWFYERYNVPNRSTIGCNWADTDGDYFLRYGDVLLMVLNTNSLMGDDVHADFVSQVCAQNGDAKWKIILEHHSSYSSVKKYQPASEGLRGHMAWLADKYDIDLFLSGHDHAYTRTAIMNGACETLGEYDYTSGAGVKNPSGAQYVTCGTGSGCIYQPLEQNYAAVVQEQPEVPTAIRVDVTGSSLKLTTYLVDSWQVLDEYTIEKD